MDNKTALAKAASLCEQGELDESNRLAERVLQKEPHNHLALAIVAMCQMKAGRTGTAYHLFRRVLDYDNREEVWNNVGYCLGERQANLREAAEWYEKCLDGKDPTAALSNLAMIYAKLGEHEKAIDHANAALRAKPGWFVPMMNAGLSHLALHNWRQGWEWYDAALGTPQRPRNSYHEDETPIWDGNGGTVLIYGEQGLGDQIMFMSMVQEAIEKAEHVILDVEPRLKEVARRSFPRATVVSSNRTKNLVLPEPREITACMAIGSLGRLFRNTTADFPGTPYLKPDPVRVAQWRTGLGMLQGRPNIGICWAGGADNTGEEVRSCKLDDLIPVLQLDANFICLNHKPQAAGEIEDFRRRTGIEIIHYDRVHRTGDYDDTLALIEALDSVVSVTTTVIHAAGSLGKNCHVLVPEFPTWRYGVAGDSMPWYRSVNLYRATNSGWRMPVNLIAGALELPLAKRQEVVTYGNR